MSGLVQRLRAALGAAGIAALALFAADVAFLALVLQPLEQRATRLERRLEQLRPVTRAGMVRAGAAPAAQLAAFYAYLERGPSPPEWLARLDGYAREAGLALPSADYRLLGTGTALERYEIALPVTGTYAELRAFLEAALAGIPVLSLDAVSFTRARADTPRVRAELRFTLHLVRP